MGTLHFASRLQAAQTRIFMKSNRPQFDDAVLALAAKLFDFARKGDTESLSAYIAAGAPANLTNEQGDSLLMLAAYHGHADTVQALIIQGADPNRVNDRGQSPLAGAVFKGSREVVLALLEGGADAGYGKPSARDMAASLERTEILALLDRQ